MRAAHPLLLVCALEILAACGDGAAGPSVARPELDSDGPSPAEDGPADRADDEQIWDDDWLAPATKVWQDEWLRPVPADQAPEVNTPADEAEEEEAEEEEAEEEEAEEEEAEEEEEAAAEPLDGEAR